MYDDEYPEIQECTKSFELTVKKIARAVIRPVDTSGASIDHAVTVLKDHAGNTGNLNRRKKTFDVSEDEGYTYEISAEGYGTVKGTFTAGQGTTEIPVTLKSNEEISQENQQRLECCSVGSGCQTDRILHRPFWIPVVAPALPLTFRAIFRRVYRCGNRRYRCHHKGQG